MDFIDSEAEESEQEEEEEEEDEENGGSRVHEKRKAKKLNTVADSSEEDEEEEEDNDHLCEELKDLIDDNPIDEGSELDDSDNSIKSQKRKNHDDEYLDDRLEDDDYDLIEENLGVKVERTKRFKRLKRFQDEDSDLEDNIDEGLAREAIAEQLFDEEVPVDDTVKAEEHEFGEEEEEDSDSDADDFIVDDEGRPIADKRKKRKPIFTDASLQEGQDIFGVDFDYDEFSKYDDDEYEEDEDTDGEEYDEEGERRVKKKSVKKKVAKSTIFDIYEPSELKRGHFTDLDNEIRKTDIPERMQLRQVPVTQVPENSGELDEEANWIYKQAFCKLPVSQHDKNNLYRETFRKPPSTVGKIKQTLEFIRNQHLEVPFIAFYRKEYVKPELNTNDLWKIYEYDGSWCQLYNRKTKLLQLFEEIREYQLDMATEKATEGSDDVSAKATVIDERMIKDEDLDRLREVQTMEELKDVHMQFQLYYSATIPKMQEYRRRKERERRKNERLERKRLAAESGEEIEGADSDEDLEPNTEDHLKQSKDSGPYAMCRKAGICRFAKQFGLTPEKFAENLHNNYQRHDVQQEVLSPTDLAKQYLCPKFMTVDEVVHAAKFVVARQLAREPLLRRTVREIFFERAKINVEPTKLGRREIDENHACYSMKYLTNKPVRELIADQFLRLVMAEEHKLITITISDQIEGTTSNSYINESKQLYHLDEFSKVVQEWNTLRAECVELALRKMVLPDLKKELRIILLQEAKDHVMKSCCTKLSSWLKVAPFRPDYVDDYSFDDWNVNKGIRAMGLAYVPDYSQAVFCAITTNEGGLSDYQRLPHMLKRKNSYRLNEKTLKLQDMEVLKKFIRENKPHVIVIGGESRDAQMMREDIQEIVKELVEDDQFPQIPCEIVDNELAKIYANSKKGEHDFKEFPPLLKQAISLARKMQDPLIEYSQLCGADEEILCLRYHSLQDQLCKEDLLDKLYIEFINQTNEVGFDINMATQKNYNVNLLQFVCGLGPRKGQALLKVLKQSNQRLENRTQLVTLCHLGPKVFINSSGFIKIDTSSLGDSTEAYVEVLDGSRVHPETYEWARKMAIDAMEYDDDEMNPAGALDEILDAPERLKDLDLDAFAVELERQGFGNKSITLYDIRAELNSLYKDLRTPYRSPTSEELFDILTKETPETFYVGKMILATVTGISHRKPQGEQLDQANPVRNDETGNWQCPFCLEDGFPELSEVWNHFDAGACPGQAIGVKLRLDNGLVGFIHIKNLSDKHVKDPEERVQVGQAIHVRIIKIDVERFSVDCSSKSSDLMDKSHEWRPRRDTYYDYEKEEKDTKKEHDKKQVQTKQQYVKRVIIHPSFHNKSYAEVVKIMETMDQGEVVVRPSSKGSDHLTVTWKVTNDIYQHIDIREEGKENAFTLGQSLWIGNEEFEDLDEIIARHVNPMAACARELLTYKYYRDTNGGIKEKMDEILKEEKKKDPRKIHYFISASKAFPGKFLLSYLPSSKTRHEYVTVVPDGFRYRGQVFETLNSFLSWFKDHYSDPIEPINTPASTTLQSNIGGASALSGYESTPRNSRSSSSSGQQHHQFSQAASLHQTPLFSSTPGYQGGYVNTPYTPSGQTPFMTPYTTPNNSHTPRYGGTPSPSSATSSSISYGNRQMHQQQHQQQSSHQHRSNPPPNLQHHPQQQQQQQQQHHRVQQHHPQQSQHLHHQYAQPHHPQQTIEGSESAANFIVPPSPKFSNPAGKGYSGRSNENLEWQIASDAWAKRKQRLPPPPPVPVHMGRATPSGGSSTHGAAAAAATTTSAATPNSNPIRPSPHIGNFGDATPLYDE